MADSGRNFRSYYYDKVGFRGVEEKKSLEKIMSEKPIDTHKLSTFCLKFTLPSMYREHVWKILLGVIPAMTECHETVMHEREENYKELHSSLVLTRKMDNNTPLPVTFTLMFFLSQGELMLDIEKQMADPLTANLISIASAFAGIGTTDVNRFFLFRRFVLAQRKSPLCHRSLENQLENLLKKNDPELHSHLLQINAMTSLPTRLWFDLYFSNVLHVKDLERLWDRIIGGSSKVLSFVAVELLITMRKDLFRLTTPQAVAEFLVKIQEDKSEIAVTKALDLCHCAI